MGGKNINPRSALQVFVDILLLSIFIGLAIWVSKSKATEKALEQIVVKDAPTKDGQVVLEVKACGNVFTLQGFPREIIKDDVMTEFVNKVEAKCDELFPSR